MKYLFFANRIARLLWLFGFVLAAQQLSAMPSSEAHLRSLMAHITRDRAYYTKDFQTLLDEFLSRHVATGFTDERLVLDKDNHLKVGLKAKLLAILDEEKKYDRVGWYTFYTAMNRTIAFTMDIMTELRKFFLENVRCQRDVKDVRNFKTTWDLSVKEGGEKTDLASHIEKRRKEIETLIERFHGGDRSSEATIAMNYFRHKNFPSEIISVNFSLFGSHGKPGEYTLRYWIENYSAALDSDLRNLSTSEIIRKQLAEKIEPILNDLGISQDQINHFFDDLLSFFQNHVHEPHSESVKYPNFDLREHKDDERLREIQMKKFGDLTSEDNEYLNFLNRKQEIDYADKHYVGGRMLAIHVRPEIVDKVVYLGPHFPLPWNDGKPSEALTLLKNDPAAFDEQLASLRERSQLWKKFLDATMFEGSFSSNQLFGAFFVDPKYVYDRNQVQLSTHDLFFRNEDEGKKYRRDLQEIIAAFLGQQSIVNLCDPKH